MVVPSGDTRSLSADADEVSDLESDSALLLRVVILSRREYCCVSSSSPLIKGNRDKVSCCAGI